MPSATLTLPHPELAPQRAHVEGRTIGRQRALSRQPLLLDEAEDLGGGGDVGAGAVDGGDAGGFEEIVVLRRDDAAADRYDITRSPIT
jgi:hypothetical protein